MKIPERLEHLIPQDASCIEPAGDSNESLATLGELRSKSEADKYTAAWADFIGTQPWQWFVTFTFKDEIHPESADKLFRVWINKLNRHVYGQRWRKKHPYGCKWVRALEWQKRGVLHYHALIANVGYANRERWSDVWRELGETSLAGFIKIDQYDDSKGGAEAYLSKYVAKGGQVDLSENFNINVHHPDHAHNDYTNTELLASN